MKHNEFNLDMGTRQRNDSRVCRNAERCERREDRVDGFADPRWSDALLRWCSLCKRLVVTGRG
jgi:hypothetical protein